MTFKNKIKYYNRYLKDSESKLSNTQNKWLELLRKDGYVMLDNLLNHSEIEQMKQRYRTELEEKLNFETPCLSQNLIKSDKHKELIDNKLQYTAEQLVDRGIAFSQSDIISYDQVIEEYRPSTLKTYILLDQLFFKIWLHPELLDIIEAYMGLRPHLLEAYIRRNFPADYKVMNHYWHRDINHKDYLLKAFVFLSDCEIEHGPHEYIRGSLKDLRLSGRNYYTDEEVDNIYPPGCKDRILSKVKAGTIILEDTRGLHRARIPDQGYRDLGYAVFVPTRIFHKYKSKFYTISEEVYNGLNMIQKSYIPKEFIV